MNRKIVFLILLVKCVSGYHMRNSSTKTFPSDFLFGVATSAYQIEGAWNTNGKSASNWDHFTHIKPHKIQDGSNADVSCDSYNKIKEDVKLLKELGVDFYRFSLSWTRIIPDPFTNKINPDGIRYYNELIDLLLENGIEPVATIFHFDLPETLQKFGGFTNSAVNKYVVKYARIVFENFGDRVKMWITFNQPHIFCLFGYGLDVMAPAYNLSGIGEYICSYNTLKAHPEIYHLYNDTFREIQHGIIDITFNSAWFEPASSSKDDIDASIRATEFEVVPWGLKKALIWIKENYGDPIIFVTENGYADNGETDDQGRVNFYKSYLSSILEAIHDHEVRIKRYTAWGLMNNFEWTHGYILKYGFYHVNFTDPNRTRKAKSSAGYYKRVRLTRKP